MRLAVLGSAGVGLIYALKATVLAPDPIPVRVAVAAAGRVEETVTNSRAGTVKARRRAKLSPEVGGKVVALPHPKGARVQRGDVLLRLEDALPRAQLDLSRRETTAAAAQRDQACLAAERARRERGRNERLAREGIVSAELLDRVTSEAEVTEAACRAATAAQAKAQAAVGLAEAELRKTVLVAPFAGVVADLLIEVGEWTTPSPPALPVPAVVDLVDLSSNYVTAPMDEVDAARLRPGLKARITVDSHPGRSFPGTVTRVAPYVLDQLEQNRTVALEVDFDDPRAAATMLPGTSADAEVVLRALEAALRVPAPALLEGGRVLVVAGGRLAERRVEVGLRNWDFAELRSGLAPGERVVLSLDRPEVKAGARVNVEDAP